MTQAGYPEVAGESWFAVVVPAGTPRDIIALLQRDIAQAIIRPDVQETPGDARLRDGRQHARGMRRPLPGGNSEMGESHRRGGPQGAVRAVPICVPCAGQVPTRCAFEASTGVQTRDTAAQARPRGPRRASHMDALPPYREAQTNSQFRAVILIVHCH
ncbi:MAG: hypothetical protein JO049_05370 [Hyphomicrobiales bacterium]|nr:hypothetical protein [Hyphomicrobiales bacterium]